MFRSPFASVRVWVLLCAFYSLGIATDRTPRKAMSAPRNRGYFNSKGGRKNGLHSIEVLERNSWCLRGEGVF